MKPGPAAFCLLLAACDLQAPLGKAVPYSPLVPDPVLVTMPGNAPFISQEFAPRQTSTPYAHYGIDIRARAGTPVIAAAPGVVVAAFTEPMHGRQVHLSHGTDQDGMRILTTYHHLQSIDVSVGDKLARGDRVGAMGASGLSAGAQVHLHFEVRRGPTRAKARPVDPHLFWADGTGKVTCLRKDQAYDANPIRLTYPVPCR
ncbi:MAG: M23 family metallopeptidase [Silicimonas sp.]